MNDDYDNAKADREALRKLRVNKARCDECGDTIESTHRHDFKSCSCGAISVDGGKDYVRRLWRTGSRYTELSSGWPEDD